MVKPKRGIVKKPTEQDKAAANWVQAGGADPELKHLDTQTSKRSPAEVLAKSKDPAYTRCTLYLTDALHKRLKVSATMTDTGMSDIAESAIAAWLDENA